MDTILWPLKVAVAWVMVRIHDFLVLIGMGKGPGAAWVLSIVGLTIVMRLLIMPLFVRQIRASRGMQLMQPELKAIQDKKTIEELTHPHGVGCRRKGCRFVEHVARMYGDPVCESRICCIFFRDNVLMHLMVRSAF